MKTKRKILSNIVAVVFVALLIMLNITIKTVGTSKGSSYYFDSAQHDGLYDSETLQKYNSHRNVKGVALTDYYAPIYFRNLKNNIGNNLYGTCNFVAIGMLLSFWDTYWSDDIIPESYESTSLFFDGTFTSDTDSPGIRHEFGPIFENLPNGYSDFRSLKSNSWIRENFFQIKLIDMWENFLDASSLSNDGMSIENISRFLFNYFYYDLGFNRSDFLIDFEKTSTVSGGTIRDFIIGYVTQGIPVMVGIGNNSNLDYGTHTVIAYDYDEDRDELYCNFGWGNNASHITIETLDYSSYNNAVALSFFTGHEHTDNYKKYNFWEVDSFCSCEYSKPFDFNQKTILENGEENVVFEWKSLNREKWHNHFSELTDYKFSVLYRGDFYIVPEVTLDDKFYVLTGNQKNSLCQCSYAIAKVVFCDYACSYFNGCHSAVEINNDIDAKINVFIDLSSSFSNDDFDINSNDGVIELYSQEPILRVDFESYEPYYDILYWDGEWINVLLSQAEETDRIFDENFGYEKIDLSKENSYSYFMEYDDASEKYSIEFFKQVHSLKFISLVDSINMEGVLIWNRLPVSGYEIPYDESLWNISPVLEGTRCYSYAINSQTRPGDHSTLWTEGNLNNPQSPGLYAFNSSFEPNSLNNYVNDIRTFMAYDYSLLNENFPDKNYRWQPIRRFDTCPEGTYKIAMFYYFDSNDDGHSSGFHWYRENPDGTWSHKSGQFFVSDKDYADEDGNRRVITDPLVCNRICRDNEEFLNYNLFGGYYAVTPWNGMYYQEGY